MGAQLDQNAAQEVKPPEENKPQENPFENADLVMDSPTDLEDKAEDSDLLIEEDGDFFWVIQKVIWGIAKTLIILGVMMILIWLVWDKSPFGAEETTKEEVPLVVKTEKKETPKKETSKPKKKKESVVDIDTNYEVPVLPPVQLQKRKDFFQLAQLSQQVRPSPEIGGRGILEHSITWLDRARILGEFSPYDLRAIPSSQRAERVEALIGEAERLFSESVGLRAELKQEFDYHKSQENYWLLEAQSFENQINTDIKKFKSQRIEGLVSQKSEALSFQAQHSSKAKIRELLGQNVTNFDRLLRQKAIPLLGPPTTLRAIQK